VTTIGVISYPRLLHAGLLFQEVLILNLRIPFFLGWLTALCRPQERGRQCAVIV